MTRRRRRVLVIDDDDTLRAVLVEALMGAGYYAPMLDDGRGALASIRAQRPDLVLLDVVMPEKDGLAVLEEMRQMDYRMPVVMMTAWPLQTLEMPGATAVLRKPFDLDTLLAKVCELIGPAQ